MPSQTCAPCWCIGCKGALRSKKIVNRHAKDVTSNFNMATNSPLEGSWNIGEMVPFYLSLYDQHPTATQALYGGAKISVLDHIYIEYRRLVAHPLHTKAAVTQSFQDDKFLKLPQPNNSCGSFEEARAKIKDFLVPLQTFHSCPNDCVIFRGALREMKVQIISLF
jgi:hypothetical protein